MKFTIRLTCYDKRIVSKCRFDFISTLPVNKTLKHVGSNPHRNFEAASFLLPLDNIGNKSSYSESGLSYSDEAHRHIDPGSFRSGADVPANVF